MVKHLLLLLGLSVLLDILQALECHNCTYVNPDGSCRTQRTKYQTKERQKCILRRYYEDGNVQYGKQFCGYTCGPETVDPGNRHQEISCCTDRDLCNSFF